MPNTPHAFLYKLISAIDIENRPYRLLAILSITLFFGGLANNAINASDFLKEQQLIIDKYGNHMSSIISDRLSNSALQKDAISAQAIAQNILKNSDISSIIIYDNTNRILAQAIDSTYETHFSSSEYTSPIIANENIIGSVAIILQSKNFEVRSQTPHYFFWLTALFALLFIVIDKIKSIQKSGVNIADKKTEHNGLAQTSEKEHKATPETTSKPCIYTVLKLHNTERLYQQINSELRKQQIALLENSIKHTLHLYGGTLVVINQECIILCFDNVPIENAIYGSQLLLALHKHHKKSLIALSAVITTSIDAAHLTKKITEINIFGQTETAFNSHIQRDIIDNNSLEKYIEYSSENHEAYAIKIEGLKPHYKKLIDNQLDNLLQEYDNR